MKYASAIQSLVVVDCCDVCNNPPSPLPSPSIVSSRLNTLSAAGIKDGYYFCLWAHVLRITQGMVQEPRACWVHIRELKQERLWYANGNRKWTDFTFNSPSHNYIHITKLIFFIRGHVV